MDTNTAQKSGLPVTLQDVARCTAPSAGKPIVLLQFSGTYLYSNLTTGLLIMKTTTKSKYAPVVADRQFDAVHNAKNREMRTGLKQVQISLGVIQRRD